MWGVRQEMISDWVACRSDSLYPERPVAFCYEGRRWSIVQIQARWRSPQFRHFRVLTETKSVFELIYDESKDRWQVEPQ